MVNGLTTLFFKNANFAISYFAARNSAPSLISREIFPWFCSRQDIQMWNICRIEQKCQRIVSFDHNNSINYSVYVFLHLPGVYTKRSCPVTPIYPHICMLNIVECLLICGHIYNYFGQRCNCALRNVRCDEEISTHFRPIFIPIFARYFHISGQHIFRQNARSAKINVPSFHFYENYLTRCDFFVDLFIERNRQ